MDKYILPARCAMCRARAHRGMEILASNSPGQNTNEHYAAAPAPVSAASAVACPPGRFVELHFAHNSLLQADRPFPARPSFGARSQPIWQQTFPCLLKLTLASVCVSRGDELLWPLCNTHQSAQRFMLQRTRPPVSPGRRARRASPTYMDSYRSRMSTRKNDEACLLMGVNARCFENHVGSQSAAASSDRA